MPWTSRRHVVNCITKGEPPRKAVGHVETTRFVVYNFETIKEKFESPTFTAHGHEWAIRIDLGDSGDTDSCVDCYLCYIGTNDVSIAYGIRCKHYDFPGIHTFTQNSSSWGYQKFIDRSKIKEFLEDDGSLVVEVDIQMAAAQDNRIIWYPPKFQQQPMLVDLYNDASSETADVVFSVEKNEYHAHKNILSLQCKKLYEIAKECDDDEPIAITSTRAKIFKSILDFAYTVKLPKLHNKDTAKELLVAADCYDCIQLKLYVESFIVENFLAPKTAAEFLLFADSYSCALLKEAATTMFATDAATVKNTEAWSKVKDSKRLLAELLDAITPRVEAEVEDCTKTFDRLDVASLRDSLEKANLEVDGSREVLVERLTKFHQEQVKRQTEGGGGGGADGGEQGGNAEAGGEREETAEA